MPAQQLPGTDALRSTAQPASRRQAPLRPRLQLPPCARTALLVPHAVLPQQHPLGLRVLRHKQHAVQARQVDGVHLRARQQARQRDCHPHARQSRAGPRPAHAAAASMQGERIGRGRPCLDMAQISTASCLLGCARRPCCPASPGGRGSSLVGGSSPAALLDLSQTRHPQTQMRAAARGASGSGVGQTQGTIEHLS